MRSLCALALMCLVVFPPLAGAEDAPSTPAKADVEQARLMQHVRWMADPARKGRGAWPDRAATADYIAAAFKKAGLQALPGQDSMFQDKAGLKEPALRNVVAWLPPLEGAKAEHVILSAHYDHLGQKVVEINVGETTTRSTTTFHGADDNASGVAAMLEIARCLGARRKADPAAFPRGLVFIAFDLEETQLLGSKHYVANPWLPLAQCAAFVTLDMLGRSIADMVPGSLFAMGTENSAVLDTLLRAAGEPKGGQTVKVGIDFQPGYSDYVPFKDAKIPYLFLTSGACEDYHRPTDVAKRIQPAHLAARTRWARDLTLRIVAAKTRPTWRDGVPPSVEEIRDVRGLIRTIQKGLETTSGVPPLVVTLVTNFGTHLDKLLADDAISKAERASAHAGAMMLFKAAQQMAGPMRGGR